MKILICDAFHANLPDRLKKFGEVTSDMAALPEAEIALVRSKTKCTAEWIDKAPKLKMIIRGGVGLDNIDAPHAKKKGILVDNTPEASSISVAELAIGLMLAVASRIAKGHEGMSQNKWYKKECERVELYGKTLGIVGCGRIGREVAIRAKAFGMTVIGYDPNVQDVSNVGIELKKTLDEVLAASDYLSLHTPLTDQTKGFINKGTISKMKKGVIIVNTGRGKCVIEEDVAEALKSGQIGGYGNDVWYSDPPQSSPLIDAPNTVLTPHIGASSAENLLRIGDIIEKKIAEFVKK